LSYWKVILILNDYEIEAPEPEVPTVLHGVAEGSLDEVPLAAWVRRVVVPIAAET